MKRAKRFSQKAISCAAPWASMMALVFSALVGSSLGAPESGQNPQPSVTAANVFQADLADVKSQPLIDAINQLKAQAKCRPPRVTFKIFSSAANDPSFEAKLVQARKEAMEKYLGSSTVKALLQPDEYQSNVRSVVAPGKDGQVELNFEKFNDQDKDPPKLRINWDPAPGTPVREGDEIKVKITASERYEDGHKSWPTGVQSIQLIANGEVQEPTGNYRPPEQCARKTLDVAYKVPKNPPYIVHLEAYAEDGATNNISEPADFPTGDWYGTLREHARGNLYNDTVTVIFSFNEDRYGAIKGAGRVRMISQSQNFTNCKITRTLITPDPLLLPIKGRHIGDEFYLELPADYRLRIRVHADCPPPQTNEDTTATRSLGISQAFMRPTVKAHDGATNPFQKPGAMDVSGSIEIHRAKR